MAVAISAQRTAVDVTSLARSALALRAAATAQQLGLATVKQAHQADQALVEMLAQATASSLSPRGQHLDITV
jgi:hypothetical protein